MPFRPISRGAARAFVFLSVLTLLLAGASAWISIRAVQGGISSRASVVQLCQAGNDSRAQQITLWTHLAQISTPPPHETPAQKQRRLALVRQLLGYVRQVFAPRNCTANFDG
jgi:hypothetical protein